MTDHLAARERLEAWAKRRTNWSRDESRRADIHVLLAHVDGLQDENDRLREAARAARVESSVTLSDTWSGNVKLWHDDSAAARRVDELNAMLVASEEHTQLHEARAEAAEVERDELARLAADGNEREKALEARLDQAERERDALRARLDNAIETPSVGHRWDADERFGLGDGPT